MFKKIEIWEFSGGPVVKNLPFNVGDPGWIPGTGIKIPLVVEQLSLHSASPDHVCPSKDPA